MAPRAAEVLQAKERQHADLRKEIDNLAQQVAQKQAELQAAKKDEDEAAATAGRLQERQESLASMNREWQSKLDAQRTERDDLLQELEGCQRAAATERGAVAAITVARDRLAEAEVRFAAAVREVTALVSDAAKQAALGAAGGDLPPGVVPAPAAEANADPLDPAELWAQQGAAGEVPSSLKAACTLQGILVALHDSLASRAAELRAGLRQWGFAESASLQTKELVGSLEADLEADRVRASRLVAETEQLASGQQARTAEREAAANRNAAAASRVALLTTQIEKAKEASQKLQADIDSATQSLVEARQRHDRLSGERAEAGRRLSLARAADEEHDGEAGRRRGAAARLAEQMQQKVASGSAKVARMEMEAAAIRQARDNLVQACAAADAQIEAERHAHGALQRDHDRLNTELEALAAHYLAALPALPGLELLPPLPSGQRAALPDAAPEGAHGAAGGLEKFSTDRGGTVVTPLPWSQHTAGPADGGVRGLGAQALRL